MHVLYFHQHFSTPEGAAGTRSYEMAQALVRSGHVVTMVCGSSVQGQSGLMGPYENGKRRGMVNGVEVIEFNLDYSNHMTLLTRARVFLKFAIDSIWVALREPADVVFATTTPLTAGIPGIFSRWIRRKPFVFEVRDLWPELPKAMEVITNPLILGVMSALEWLSYHSANRLIGLSPGIVEGITKRGIPRDRIELIPNGCDFGIFGTPVTSWRPKGVRAEDFMAIFTGAHGVANGLDAVLDVANELKKRKRPDIKLVFVGDGKLKPSLLTRAQSEGLDNVIFQSPVPKNELAGLMESADIGLQILANIPAFYYGTSPNKFFDYVASGLPVLCNYPGWIAELIDEFNCGFSVPPEDRSAFADALIRAADSRGLLEGQGLNALKLAKGRFARSELSRVFVEWLEGARQ